MFNNVWDWGGHPPAPLATPLLSLISNVGAIGRFSNGLDIAVIFTFYHSLTVQPAAALIGFDNADLQENFKINKEIVRL